MADILHSEISTEQFRKAVELGQISFTAAEEAFKADAEQVMSLFNRATATEYEERFGQAPTLQGLSGGMTETGEFPVTTAVQGDYIDSVLRPYGSLIEVSGTFLRWNKYKQLNSHLTAVNKETLQGFLLDHVHKFTFNRDTAYTDRNGRSIDVRGGDALAWIATNHLMNNGSTVSNDLGTANTARVAESTVEAAVDLGNDFIGHNGLLNTTGFDTIYSGNHSQTVNVISRLCKQGTQVITGVASSEPSYSSGVHNGMNPYQGQFRHVILPLLATNADGSRNATKLRKWGLLNSRLASGMDGNLISRVGMAPKMFPPREAERKDALLFKSMAEYDILHVNPLIAVDAQPS